MITRRTAIGAIAGAGAAAGDMAKSVGGQPVNWGVQPEQFGIELKEQVDQISKPKMSRALAAKAVFVANPDLYEAARSICFQNHRNVDHIDPDIAVLKSLSPMAKITFQRQRNVEREMTYWWNVEDMSITDRIHAAISELMWGKQP